MTPLEIFSFGAFLGGAVFTAVIIATALVGPALGQSAMRGAVGVVGLSIFAAVIGGALAVLFMPLPPILPVMP